MDCDGLLKNPARGFWKSRPKFETYTAVMIPAGFRTHHLSLDILRIRKVIKHDLTLPCPVGIGSFAMRSRGGRQPDPGITQLNGVVKTAMMLCTPRF